MLVERYIIMLDVLIAEDDLTIADLLQDILEQSGYTVTAAVRSVDEAIIAVEKQLPDFAIIDLHLANGSTGTDLARHLRQRANVGIIFSTGNDNQEISPDVADAVMVKPYRLGDVVSGLRIISELATAGHTDIKPPRSFRLLKPLAAEAV